MKGEEMSMRSTPRRAAALSHVAVKKAVIASGPLVLAIATAAVAPPAQAHHGNGTERCNRAFQGTFGHLDNLPIHSQSTGERLGHISLSSQYYKGGIRTCAVVIRAHHKHKRFSGVRIKPAYADRPSRRKTARSRWGVGPVVYRARCVKVRGTISRSSHFKAYCYTG